MESFRQSSNEHLFRHRNNLMQSAEKMKELFVCGLQAMPVLTWPAGLLRPMPITNALLY